MGGKPYEAVRAQGRYRCGKLFLLRLGAFKRSRRRIFGGGIRDFRIFRSFRKFRSRFFAGVGYGGRFFSQKRKKSVDNRRRLHRAVRFDGGYNLQKNQKEINFKARVTLRGHFAGSFVGV